MDSQENGGYKFGRVFPTYVIKQLTFQVLQIVDEINVNVITTATVKLMYFNTRN